MSYVAVDSKGIKCRTLFPDFGSLEIFFINVSIHYILSSIKKLIVCLIRKHLTALCLFFFFCDVYFCYRSLECVSLEFIINYKLLKFVCSCKYIEYMLSCLSIIFEPGGRYNKLLLFPQLSFSLQSGIKRLHVR